MSAWVAEMESASADTGTHTSVVSAPLPHRARGLHRPVACVPQAPALGLVGRPREVRAAAVGGQLGGVAGLGLHLGGGAAVELDEQGGSYGERGLVVAVDGLDLALVGQFDARHRDGVLADHDRALHRGIDAGERALGGGGRLRGGMQAERRLADEPERAL